MAGAFHHGALLYAGEDEFVTGALGFLREGLARGEPVLVAATPRKIELLRGALGADASLVAFADMTRLGANPARIIPAWREFVEHAGGRPARGIGEPAWPGRSAAELAECHLHEALLNVAFAGAAGFRLLCPYDTTAFGADVIAQVQRCHPLLVEGSVERASATCASAREHAAPCTDPLPEPDAPAETLAFDISRLPAMRRSVRAHAAEGGLRTPRDEDLVLAVNELATNSCRHGGGRGTLRLWRDDGVVVCEVRDRGRIEDPLAGRRLPDRSRSGGYGLWLANQVCDLVQLRTTPDGGVVRVHMRAGEG